LAYKIHDRRVDSTFNNMPELVSLSLLYDVKNCKLGRLRAPLTRQGGRKPLLAFPA
jgi:hypothetical protein